jgi:hypothetical protein
VKFRDNTNIKGFIVGKTYLTTFLSVSKVKLLTKLNRPVRDMDLIRVEVVESTRELFPNGHTFYCLVKDLVK